jgi:hypothetical protein
VAGEPPPGRVHGDESAVDVGGEDAVVDTLHHRGEEPLAPAHLLLRHPERLLHLLEGGHQLLGLLLRDRELVLDDHPGRRRAEGGGEEPLEADSEREQLRHRQVRGRLAAEQLPHDRLGFIIPHVVVDEALDLGCGEDGGRPRRDLLLARRADEGGGLRAVVGILLAQQRDHDEESDVHEERPKDPVADGVEPRQAEECRRPKEVDPERPLRQERGREHALADEGGQDQRVEPDEEPRRDPRRRSLAAAPAPVEPEHDRRRALRDGDEGQKAHLDQQQLAALHARPQQSEREHAEHGEARVEQRDPVDVLGVAPPQQHGQNHVVGDHLGQCEGVHHDHRRRRGEAPEEHHHRDEVAVEVQREPEDEAVRLGARLREHEEPGEGDGQHEQVDEEQVERERPRDRVDVALTRILDHQHVELPRQEHDRRHRDHEHRRPPRVGGGLRPVEDEQTRPVRVGGDPPEEIAEAPEETPRDVDADKQEGEELHHGLHGDGGHEPGLLLGEVEVPRAEEDTEQGERDGNEQRRVEDVQHRSLAGNHLEGRRDGLELERDVRDHAAHDEDGDERAEGRRLAVAARDEVGDRRDALVLGHPHQLSQEDRPQERDTGGAEVDRQELEAAVGGEPHAAVERPRRAVHRGGEHIGQRANAPRAHPRREGLPERGDGEEKHQVPEDDAEQRGLGEPGHGSSSGGRARRARSAPTRTIAAQSPNRYSTSGGTPNTSVERLAMARRGQTRHAPKSRKQATTSSAAFIGSAGL